jgi:hypothetical protein
MLIDKGTRIIVNVNPEISRMNAALLVREGDLDENK